MTYYGWLTEGSAFAKKPLLGKWSRDYVVDALKGVEIIEKPEQLSGKRADLVILDRNPLTCPPEEIRRIRVLRTIKAGETVYEWDGREEE